MNESIDPKETQRIPAQGIDEKFIRLMKGLFFAFLIIQLLVMIFRPLSDPSECRYGNMAANMASAGNFIEPKYIYDGVFQCFEGKPPLFFQLGGIACLLFGKSAFAVRFPSFVFSLITVWIVFVTVRKVTNRKNAWVAALLCFLNPMFYIYSGLCATDMMLTCCIAGGVLAYFGFTDARAVVQSKKYSLLFILCLALGMMVKGPVAIVSIGLPVFLFVAIYRKWDAVPRHAWMSGFLLFAVIVFPWFYCMQNLHPDFLTYFFYNENFARFLLKEYGDKFGNGHDSFRGVAFFIAILSNLPILAPLLMLLYKKRLTISGIKSRNLEGISLIAAAALTVFWCTTNRVPLSYLLPTIPFLAIFTVLKLVETEQGGDDRRLRVSVYLTAAMGIITASVLVVLTIFSTQVTSKMPAPFYQHILRQEKKMGVCTKEGYYFFRKTPLSAEFYLGDRVRNHPDEKGEASLTNSRPYNLLITDKNLSEITKPLNRKRMLEHGKWNLFSPEQPEDQ